ncbi:RNA polymerase sigma factor [Streptomyces sp. NPDC127110]|uniref:RNA polymerase sigma factor n=1 Tax=Streptomyces sp. NPDC127110 TaxID=3345362 RepID=UPI00362E4892
MPQTPSASDSPSCDGQTGHPLEVAASLAAQDPANKAALAELFAAMYEPVVRFMEGRVQDPATAEDLAQEVFVKIVQKIDSYTGGGIFAWIWAIARNVYFDYCRPMRNRGFEQLTADFSHLDEPSTAIGPIEAAEWREVRRAIKGKLVKLPPSQQQVLELRFVAEYSAAETAEIMGKPAGTIRVLQCRALAKLRKLMPESDSNMATYLLSASDAQRQEGVMAAAPVMPRERHDAESMG